MKIGIIFLCIILSGCDQITGKPRETDQPIAVQRFQMLSDGTGNAWRWNAVTGETWKCWQGTPGVKNPTCYPTYTGQ